MTRNNASHTGAIYWTEDRAKRVQAKTVKRLKEMGRWQLAERLSACSIGKCCMGRRDSGSVASVRACHAACAFAQRRVEQILAPALMRTLSKHPRAWMTTCINRKREIPLSRLPSFKPDALKKQARRAMEKLWEDHPKVFAVGTIDFELRQKGKRWLVQPHLHLIIFNIDDADKAAIGRAFAPRDWRDIDQIRVPVRTVPLYSPRGISYALKTAIRCKERDGERGKDVPVPEEAARAHLAYLGEKKLRSTIFMVGCRFENGILKSNR